MGDYNMRGEASHPPSSEKMGKDEQSSEKNGKQSAGKQYLCNVKQRRQPPRGGALTTSKGPNDALKAFL